MSIRDFLNSIRAADKNGINAEPSNVRFRVDSFMVSGKPVSPENPGKPGGGSSHGSESHATGGARSRSASGTYWTASGYCSGRSVLGVKVSPT